MPEKLRPRRALLVVEPGMVADLLERGEEPEHEGQALEGRGGQIAFHGVPHEAFVEGRLGRREDRALVDDDLAGEILGDGRVGLEPSQDEGAGYAPEALGGLGVALELDGSAEGLPEGRLGPEVARQHEVDYRAKVFELVLDRRAGKGEPIPGLERAEGPRSGGRGVLEHLGLVGDDEREAPSREVLGVPEGRVVARHDDISVRPEAPSGAVVGPSLEAGGKAPDLAHPVDEQGGRRHDEEASLVAPFLAKAQHEGNGLDSLAQAHVVRDETAEAARKVRVGPAIATLLIGPQASGESRGQRRHAFAQEGGDELPGIRRKASLVGEPGAHKVEGVREALLPDSETEESRGLLGRDFRVQIPVADEVLVGAGEGLEGLLVQGQASHREPPIEAQQGLEPESRL